MTCKTLCMWEDQRNSWSRKGMCAFTCIYIHVHTRTDVYACTHTHTHTHPHGHIVYMHACAYTHIYTQL